jgi:regulatory protein RepA
MEKFDLVPLLDYIDPDESYNQWINVGMALKKEGYSLDVWDEWSSRGSKYNAGECADKWESFNENSTALVTGATITQLAKQGGWAKRSSSDEDKNLPFWGFTFDDLLEDPAMVDPEDFKKPGDEWDGAHDAIRYLQTVFQPEERVGIITKSFQGKDGKWHPIDANGYQFTCSELISRLKDYGRTDMAFGALQNEAAGGWIRINPLDGKGGKNANVTAFRFALIESDNMPLGKQMAMIRNLQLPCAAVVYSGGKSVHALVHIDAANIQEYGERVRKLYEVCKRQGFKVDEQNKNPSRLSRLPGVTRNGEKQFLVDTDIGKKNWEEWLDWVGEQDDELPPFENLADVFCDMPELAPALIDGLLRTGHKGLLTGPSKAGKSFLLMQLAVAVASGKTWLKWQCRKGKVLYINLEIDKASFDNRFQKIYEKLGTELKADSKNIDFWPLRGKAETMDKLAKKIVRRAKGKNYSLIIVDPIYKVITGDENAASDMAYFGNQFDYICNELGCSVLYCHHHSKGAQGMKKAGDRGSGSGVFTRDADAIIDMTPLEVPIEQQMMDNAPAYCVSTIVREFPSTPDFAIRFRYPIHELDDNLDPAKTEGSIAGNRTAGNLTQTSNKEKRYKDFIELLEVHLKAGDRITQKQMAEQIGVSLVTARRYFDRANSENEIYSVENKTGLIRWSESTI